MTCAVPLASTGAPVGLMLALGLLALVVGVVLARWSRGRAALLVLPLLLLTLVTVDNRRAVAADCVLTITQTSVNTGLGPGVAPSPLTAEVTNRAPESTVVTAITVEITGVTKTASAVEGPCDASDYLLLDARMPVGRTLRPYETVPFSGASIGFIDKSTNQDACQGARVTLRYTSE